MGELLVFITSLFIGSNVTTLHFCRPPDSDWRKDLMAGRRRSPPEMPENSYYGYEKHKSRKRSRDRYRINERESVHDRPNLGFDGNRERRSEALVHHHSPEEEGPKPKHRLYRGENLRTDYIGDDEKRHRKARHKYRDPTNSDSKRMVTGKYSVGEIRLKDDSQHYKVACAKEKFPEMNDKIKRQNHPLSPHSTQKRRRSPSPEGPTLPPELSKTRMPVTFSKGRTSSPSSSESEESGGSGSSSGNSSSDSGSGSSSSSCSDSTSEEEEEAVPIPEAPEWTKFPKIEATSPSDSSSSASGNSCEDGCSSGVSVSGSSSDSSSSEESQQEECQRVDRSYHSDCLRTTEGPELPPIAIEPWRSHSKHEQSRDFQVMSRRRNFKWAGSSSTMQRKLGLVVSFGTLGHHRPVDGYPSPRFTLRKQIGVHRSGNEKGHMGSEKASHNQLKLVLQCNISPPYPLTIGTSYHVHANEFLRNLIQALRMLALAQGEISAKRKSLFHTLAPVLAVYADCQNKSVLLAQGTG
ncbi:tumor differentially expressed protein [Clonorchis sinensis]|uniref:Tumor differentially expressed protein n=1 Tax=Clonorchis sinensis TaxID=79923 RepID=G7YCX8_CLOSI|nr:tumor differentially expressed protein [Clonorchis sinensis]